jgi:sporulation protein YlmC with PRC-barrel domain
MRKSLGAVCAVSAVAVFAGWAAVSGTAGPRDAQASAFQQQGFGQPQYPFYGQPQPGLYHPGAIGTTMPTTPQQYGGFATQQFGFDQGIAGAQAGPGQYGGMQPGMMAMGAQQSLMQLEQAAQQLRVSIQTLSQQPPSEQREIGLQSAYRALMLTQEAMSNLAPQLAHAQFGTPYSPWATGMHWQQQFHVQPGAWQFGFAQQPFQQQHFAHYGTTFAPGMVGQQWYAQPAWTTQWERTRTQDFAVTFEGLGDPRDGLLGVEPQRLRNTQSAERILEAEVRGLGGRNVGTVESIVLANGKAAALVVRSGGALGAEPEHYRIPWAQVRVSPTADYVYVPVMSREEADKYRKAALEELREGELRVAQLLDDSVNLKDGTHYGRVGDVLISPQGELVGVVVRPGRRAPGAQIVVAYDPKVFARDADTHTIPYDREQVAKVQPFNYVNLALVGPERYMTTRLDRVAVWQPPAPVGRPTPALEPAAPPAVQPPAPPAAEPQVKAPEPAAAAATAELKPVLPEPPVKPAEAAEPQVKPAEAQAKPAETPAKP